MRSELFPLCVVGALLAGWLGQDAQEPGRLLSERVWHLGDDDTPEWPEAPAAPDHASELVLRFDARADAGERALEIEARHVDGDWAIDLNGQSLGNLVRGKELQRHIYPMPPGVLVEGENLLRIAIGRVGDDITVGGIRLLDRPYREIFAVVPLRVRVTDADGAGLSARITLAHPDGSYARTFYRGVNGTPVRDGFAYTDADGGAVIEVSAGDYQVWATRGMEWSVDGAELRAAADAPTVELQLVREVDSRGYASMDTHLHTYTFSGHGDATLDERVLSLAAEGVDVAIATDHNHQADYRPRQRELGLADAYLAIVGNEVTTPVGHFNAFPLPAGGPLPPHELEDWMQLSAGMRRAGAQVVILNHPRWPNFADGPFGKYQLDPATGIFKTGLQMPVDAIEVFNSTVVETHWRRTMQDWFGLLNHGILVKGVGSSDSHTVTDPAGQGRTYVACAREIPREEDVDALCTALLAGNATMSQGLYLEATIGDMPPGTLVAAPDQMLDVVVRAACASWARVERIQIWVNGSLAAEVDALPDSGGAPTDFALPIGIDLPHHDCWVVVVAEGPKPDAPWWYTLQDELSAITNPIFIDRDLDGRWSSPKRSAEILLERFHGDEEGLRNALESADEAVRSQAAALRAAAAEPTDEPQ